MGDKSPKSTHKQANQKQTKTDAVNKQKKAVEDAKHVPAPVKK